MDYKEKYLDVREGLKSSRKLAKSLKEKESSVKKELKKHSFYQVVQRKRKAIYIPIATIYKLH